MSTVLIVDDACVAQMILEHILATAGHRVVDKVEDGGRAIARYRELRPDVVFLDLSLRDQEDGFSVLRQIRELDAQARVIICSAVRLPEKQQEAMALGAAGFLHKPVSPAQVLEAMGG